MDDARRFVRLGTIAVGVTFGGLLLWSVFAPLSSAVVATGQVAVESSRRTIQHPEGGVVSEILIEEGDRVKAGDPLIRIENRAPSANVRVLTEQLAEGIARLARLLAERDGLETIPDDSLAFKMAPGDLDFAANLESQESLLSARVSARATELALLKERARQQERRIEGYRTQLKSLAAQKALITEELDGVKKLNAEGYAPVTRVRELERASESLAGDQGRLTAAIAEAQSVIAESRLEAERLTQQYRIDAAREAQDLQIEVASIVEKRAAAVDTLGRTVLKAPDDGMVLGLRIRTIGGVIAPGAPLMDIVPSNDGLVVRARIAPSEVDRILPGQSAMVRFSAFNQRTTPEAKGSVLRISADALYDESTGASFYEVTISLPPDDELRRVLNGQALLPGMPAEAFIATGSRPAISYLLSPLTDAFSHAMREE
jgi:HlyD family type I secretion membrane fusion protein